MKTKKLKEQKVNLTIVPGHKNDNSPLPSYSPKRYSHTHDAHIINPENLHKKIRASKYLKNDGIPEDRQYGHPDLIDVLEKAVMEVHKYLNLPEGEGPKFLVKDISPSDDLIRKMCNKSDDEQTPGYDESRAGCRFGGHISHVTGLDVDVAFLYAGGDEEIKYHSINATKPSQIKNSAAIENLIFLSNITNNPEVEMVIIKKSVYEGWIMKRNKVINYFKSLKSNSKKPNSTGDLTPEKIDKIIDNLENIKINSSIIHKDGYKAQKGAVESATEGHWRHFHIRLKMRDDKVNSSNLKASEKQKESPSNEEEIRDLKQKVSYVFGTLDDNSSTVLESFNEDFKMHGASMQKLPALLVNLSLYKDGTPERITLQEMAFLLAYQKGKLVLDGDNRGIRVVGGTHSNHLMRYLQGSKPGKTRNGKPWNVATGHRGSWPQPEAVKKKLPQITKKQFREWSKNIGFGTSTIGGSGGNRQSSMDIFNLLSELYISSNSKDENNKGKINKADAEMVIRLMDRDAQWFAEKFEKPGFTFLKGQRENGYDREIFGIREDSAGSLKSLTENYLKSKGLDIKIDKIYGKGGWYRTLNYGIILEISGQKYIFVCYTKKELTGTKKNNLKFISSLLADILSRYVKR